MLHCSASNVKWILSHPVYIELSKICDTNVHGQETDGFVQVFHRFQSVASSTWQLLGFTASHCFSRWFCGQESGNYFWISKKKSMLDVKGQETVICIRRLPHSRYVELLMRDHFVPHLKNPPVYHRTIERERESNPACVLGHSFASMLYFLRRFSIKKYSFFKLRSSGCLQHVVPKFRRNITPPSSGPLNLFLR